MERMCLGKNRKALGGVPFFILNPDIQGVVADTLFITARIRLLSFLGDLSIE